MALRDLNAIALAVLVPELRRRIEVAGRQGFRCVALDGATLLESELAQDCDALVAVIAPAEDRVRRIMAREGISEEYARKRIASQRSDEWICQRCSYVLLNDCMAEEFRARARALFEKILTEKQTGEGSK
jgi:dephospho-CoA kinase